MVSFLIILIWLGNIFTIDVDGSREHAMYLSVLEIEQLDGNNKGTIKIKIFANDLEDAIFNFSKKRIDLSKGECENEKVLITNYFKNHLKIINGDDLLAYNLTSCEVNDISIWLSFDLNTVGNWTTVNIKADYLMELFPTQSNIVNVIHNGEKRMFRLTIDSPTKSLTFSN